MLSRADRDVEGDEELVVGLFLAFDNIREIECYVESEIPRDGPDKIADNDVLGLVLRAVVPEETQVLIGPQL